MIVKILWAVTLLFALLAGAVLVLTILASAGAPQQAAGAAIACAVAIIPYVFTRAAESLSK